LGSQEIKKKIIDQIKILMSQIPDPQKDHEKEGQLMEDENEHIPILERACALQFNRSPSTIENEISFYKDEEITLICKNPLEWWKAKEKKYPKLSVLAKKFLSIQPTEVPCERIFSDVGNIITEKRSRLDSSNAEKIVFLFENRNISHPEKLSHHKEKQKQKQFKFASRNEESNYEDVTNDNDEEPLDSFYFDQLLDNFKDKKIF